MTIVRAFRLLLGLMAAVVVGWSFFHVGARIVHGYELDQTQPIALTVLHWGDQDEDKIVDSLTRQYQADHPNVRIDRINPGANDYQSKLKTMMAAGTPPDVFYMSPDLLAELATNKLVAPLEDRFDAEPKAWRDDFFPLLIDAFRYDVATGLTGTRPGAVLYGIPKDFTTAVFYINCNLFDRAGIDYHALQKNGWTWDEFEADMKRITALNDQPEFKGTHIYGGLFDIWPDTLRNILWTYGGDFFGTRPDGTVDFRDVTLGSPPSQAALQMIVRTRLIDKTVFNATGIAKDGGKEFFNGHIGCEGPVGRWKVPGFATINTFKWDVVPIPHATQQASQIYYTAWVMSAQTAHPDNAYDLIKFLCGKAGQIQQAHLALAIPCLKSIAYSPDFLSPPGLPPHDSQLFLDAMSYAHLQQLPREPEWTRIVGDHITSCIQLGETTPKQVASDIRQRWLDELDSPLRRHAWKPMNWVSITSITAALVVTAAFLLWLKARREKVGPLDRAQQRAGFTFVAPWVIGFLCLTLGPMVLSLMLSFSKWSGMIPLGGAQNVGLANYRQIFTGDKEFYWSLQVTAYFVILAVPLGQVAALAVALLMNSRVRGITFFRTVYFVPSVISGAVLAVMWLQMFNKDYGALNLILNVPLHWIHLEAPDWFGVDAKVWAIPALVIMGLWGVGGGMIIYLAGLKGIPVSLYEASRIDGAGAVRRFWNVTLPMLSPLIFYNFVMGIIGSFQIFTQVFIMTAGGPDNDTLFYVLNLYRQAFEFHNMGYASAMAWILFAIVLVITLAVFAGSRKLVYYEGLKS